MPTSTQDVNYVPIISLENYEQRKDQIVNEIKGACENSGFLTLVNHGLEDTIEEMMYYSKIMFTSLSIPQKREFQMQSTSGNRGFTVNHEEELQKGVIDNKESFNVCRTETDDGKYWPKIEHLPDEIKDFKEKAQACFNTCHEFASNKILNVLALGLGWEEDFFQKNHSEKPHTLRLLHYPPPADVSSDIIGAGEHSDYGTITLLFQDTVGGLQVRDGDNNWFDVKPIHNAIVVNIADLLDKWTYGKYRSTKHRVIRKPTSIDRYSIAFFIHPNSNTLVHDITAGEYLHRRLTDTHTTTYR